MTTFSTQTGFNGLSVVTSGASFFGLQKGFNGISVATNNNTFFSLQKGFNGVSVGFAISTGRVFDGGLPVLTNINVTVESSQGSYSYSGVNQPFAVYHYTDVSGNPIALTITVSASGYQDSIQIVTPSATGQFIDFNMTAIVYSGLADILESVPVASIPVEPESDACLCAIDCQYQEIVLSDADTLSYKNDSSAFLFDRASAGNSIDFELWKAGTKVADLNDGTYGTYYDGFTSQPLYKGFVIDWLSVTSVLGFGLYQFRAVKSIFGTASTFESRLFRALPYSDDLADGSVVVKSIQTGNIIANSLDYTDLLSGGWVSQYRINGRFGDKTPSFEADSYQSSDYSIQQIRDQVKNEYTLECRLLPATVADWLTENAVLSNRLFITDYNILNSVIYRQLPVKVSNFEETNHYPQSRLIKYVIKFTDETPNIIKRNF